LFPLVDIDYDAVIIPQGAENVCNFYSDQVSLVPNFRHSMFPSTMLRERLNDLVICGIKKDVLDNIDLDIVLENFTLRNARMWFFLKCTETFSYLLELISHGTVFFSHNKSANSAFSHDLSAKRTLFYLRQLY
jgi:hypothetical protein